MADSKLTGLSAISQANVDDTALLYIVDVTGGNVSRKVTKGNLFAGTKTTQLVIGLPTGPTGSASVFYGGVKIPAATITFSTTAQSNDYYTNFLDQATLVNPSAGVIPNAATLKIVGAPIASTNVTITNAYALWVASGNSLFAGTLTSTGGITMSSADITLAGNKIKTTTYSFFESAVGGVFQPSSGNTQSFFSVAGSGSSTVCSLRAWRVYDATATNFELMQLGSEVLTANRFELVIQKGGTGILRPFFAKMGGQDMFSLDTANTITSYVDFLQTTGKKLSLNVGATSYFIETSANQIDTFVNSVQGLRIVLGTTTTTEVNTVFGRLASLATNASDGFSYMPSGAGTPTGTPTAFTGKVAFYYDSTNNIIYIYNGAWKKTAALT